MRRNGDVVSKHQLLDEVWGHDFEGDPNIVEVYVGYLRRKVDAPFSTHTHPHRARRRLPGSTKREWRAEARSDQ